MKTSTLLNKAYNFDRESDTLCVLGMFFSFVCAHFISKMGGHEVINDNDNIC